MWYPARVWIINIFVISPIIFVIVATVAAMSAADSNFSHFPIDLFFIIALIATFLSLPTLVATYITFLFSVYINASWVVVQVLCCIVANIGISVTIWLLGLSMGEAVLKMYFVATNISFLIIGLRLGQYLNRWFRV